MTMQDTKPKNQIRSNVKHIVTNPKNKHKIKMKTNAKPVIDNPTTNKGEAKLVLEILSLNSKP